jgi:hypothetical protein
MRANMKDNSYRILKLKSGEELITKITSSKNDKLTIERPMIFKSTTITDPYGRAKEITILKNWLIYSDHEETSIPKDFVASFLKPDLDVLELYRLEKKKDEELKKQKNRIIKKPTKDTTKKKNTDAENEFDSIMNLLNKYKNKDDIVDKIMDNIENMSDEEFQEMQESQENDFENYITMNIVLPPEALLSLVDSGLIDEEEILRMIHALKSQADLQSKMNNNIMKYYDRNKNYKNHGKDWQDWSPFPEDYLNDEDLD